MFDAIIVQVNACNDIPNASLFQKVFLKKYCVFVLVRYIQLPSMKFMEHMGLLVPKNLVILSKSSLAWTRARISSVIELQMPKTRDIRRNETC